MKLEIKHLAAYLPYDVRCFNETHGIQIMDCWSANSMIKSGSRVHLQGVLAGTSKMILRPLSDLDKLDGDFATSHSICKMLGNGEDYGSVTIYHFNGEVTIETETDSDTVGYVSLDFSTTQLIREELLKSHYDIFGLIKKGLAIDINTLHS